MKLDEAAAMAVWTSARLSLYGCLSVVISAHAAVPELDEVKTSDRKMEGLLHAISQQHEW